MVRIRGGSSTTKRRTRPPRPLLRKSAWRAVQTHRSIGPLDPTDPVTISSSMSFDEVFVTADEGGSQGGEAGSSRGMTANYDARTGVFTIQLLTIQYPLSLLQLEEEVAEEDTATSNLAREAEEVATPGKKAPLDLMNEGIAERPGHQPSPPKVRREDRVEEQ